MRIGMLTELHPDLDHNQICRLLIGAELNGGLDLKQLCLRTEATAGADQ